MSPVEDGQSAGIFSGIQEPDAHGQAALLLAESMLHTLVDRAVLTAAQATSVVETAAEVKVELATSAGESKERMDASLSLLSRIAASFAADGKGWADGRA